MYGNNKNSSVSVKSQFPLKYPELFVTFSSSLCVEDVCTLIIHMNISLEIIYIIKNSVYFLIYHNSLST